jgi:glyoxylase-like metal-dependent hydrolase (beta-lactamase superfamily II)
MSSVVVADRSTVHSRARVRAPRDPSAGFSGNPKDEDWVPASTGTNGKEQPFTADLAIIRKLAGLLPGPKPIAVNGIRVAASIRPKRFVIGGGGDSPVTMPRTAFQAVYPDCTVMIDSGLDRETHDSFSTPDKREPYFPDAFAKLQQALNAARMIVLTHFHADHVAGVTRAANFDELAAKAIISAETAHCLVNTPHRPHLKLTPDEVARFVVVDYRNYYPVAPGMVLIKAQGHSADHQMVYIALQSGREILHSVDVGWVLENIREVKGKAAPWVKEDVPAVLGQLRWLNDVLRNEPNVTILVTHDDALFERVTDGGLVGGELTL